MKIEEEEAKTILCGAVDEIAEHTMSLLSLAGFIKNKNQSPFSVLNPTTKGAVFSEGSTFFILENEKKPHSYAEVLAVEIINKLEIEDIEPKAKDFLQTNGLQIEDIDAVILGFNGDVDFDIYYNKLSENVFENTPQVYYKHLSGEYNTASAFGLFVGSKIIKTQQIPTILKVNLIEKTHYKTILLYNQYRGLDHSFVLISGC